MQLPNAFAHNDYRHKRPLHDALENGFTYVEADIYLRGNKLIVTHILPILKSNRTLEELYLKPLLEYVSKNKNGNAGNQSPITLVIDIKSDAQKTFAALLLLLEKYKTILSAYENGRVMLREVTVVITGNKPIELIKEKTNRLVFLDQDLRHVGMGITANTSPIASCKYSNILKWKGRGPISPVEKKRLCDFVNKAHQNGCKVCYGPRRKKLLYGMNY